MLLSEGVEGIEERSACDTVEFYQFAVEVSVYDRFLDAAQEELLQQFLGFLGMARVAHVFVVERVRLAALNPATVDFHFLEPVDNGLVGVHDYALGIGYARAEQYAGHTLAYTVLDAVARVYNEAAFVFEALQEGNRPHFTAHVEYNMLVDSTSDKLLLAIYVDLASAFAQLLGNKIEDGGIIAYMVWRKRASAHYPGDFY
jgi:hypothetical protein